MWGYAVALHARSFSCELRSPFVGASKFLILIMNFEDAQFVTPPVRRVFNAPAPTNQSAGYGVRLVQ